MVAKDLLLMERTAEATAAPPPAPPAGHNRWVAVALIAFILLVAATQSVTVLKVRSLESDFAAHLEEHLEHDVAAVRNEVASLTAELEATASRIEGRLATGGDMSRAALFELLNSEISSPLRGARILSSAQEPVAWWGEDLPFTDDRRYLFDTTNVYLVATRSLGDRRIQTFARIANTPGAGNRVILSRRGGEGSPADGTNG